MLNASDIGVVALVGMAIHHRWRVYMGLQTVWKGGGFGMFSDIREFAVLAEVSVRRGNELRWAVVNPSAAPLLAHSYPSESHLRALAVEMASRAWQAVGDSVVAWDGSGAGMRLPVGSVRLTRVRLDFDAATGTYRGAPDGHVCVDVQTTESGPWV
jgi:hypothetical protein